MRIKDRNTKGSLRREQAAADKLRREPGGGQYLCLPSHGAYRAEDCCMPACGPDGVPWLLVTYDMPDHTARLRLTNLTTGTTTLLLTVGRESLLEDCSEEEEEEEVVDRGSETGEHSGGAGSSSNAAPAAAADHPALDVGTAMPGQPSMEAARQAAAYPHRQTDDPEQPSAQLELGQQHSATIEEEATAVPIDRGSAHQGPCPAESSMPGTHPRPVSQGPDSAVSAAAASNLQPAPATCVPAIDGITLATCAKTCSQALNLEDLPQDADCPPQAVPKASDHPQALLGHAPGGLGLQDKLWRWQFLEDGRHVFLEGRSVDSPSEASCWQVLSIPEGQTTALTCVPHGMYETASLVEGRWIIAQTRASLLVFHMATLQLCCKVDLLQVLRLAANADLMSDRFRHGFLIAASKTCMAVEITSRCSSSNSICRSVLVFEISTGRLHASYNLPPQHEVTKMQWIAPEPYPVLAIRHCMDGPAWMGRATRLYSRVIGLHVYGQACVELSHVQRDPGSCMENLIWPAPGSSLVLGFRWHDGKQPALHVTDWRSGATIHTHPLEGSIRDIYLACESLTPTRDNVQIACHSIPITHVHVIRRLHPVRCVDAPGANVGPGMTVMAGRLQLV